jgi:hypothetical protein
MAVSDDPHASDHESDGEGLDEEQYQVATLADDMQDSRLQTEL